MMYSSVLRHNVLYGEMKILLSCLILLHVREFFMLIHKAFFRFLTLLHAIFATFKIFEQMKNYQAEECMPYSLTGNDFFRTILL